MRKAISFILLLLVASAMFNSDVSAITVGNADFEEPAVGVGDYTYTLYPWVGVQGGAYPPWISHNYYGDEPAPQSQVAVPEGGWVYQKLEATYVEGGAYVFSIDVSLSEAADGWEIFFYDADAGSYNAPLVSVKHTDPGQSDEYGWVGWDRKSVTYIATAQEDGHAIGIGFAGTGVYSLFDNAAVTVPVKAFLPEPWNGQEDVLTNASLSWWSGRDPNAPNMVDPSLTAYNLYMSNGSPTDPNLSFVDTIAVTDGQLRCTYAPPEPLGFDKTYYWRVDAVREGDANALPGDVWVFKTAEAVPVIDPATPADIFVDAGSDPELTVIAANPFTGSSDDVSYQWYKVGTPDQMLEDGAEYSGTRTAVLAIIDVQVDDEGQYYCVVTNTYGNNAMATSRSARVTVKKIVGWWKLDEASGSIASDSSGLGNTGTVAGDPVWKPAEGMDGGALDLDGTGDAIDVPGFSLTSNTVTFTAWINGWKANNWAGIVFSRRSNQACGMHFGANNTLHYTWNNNAASTYNWTEGPVIPRDEWAFVAVTIEPDRATAYVYSSEGGLQFSSNEIAHIAQTIDNLKLGWDSNDEARRFRGLLDDVRIYNYALQPLEIADVILEVKPDASMCLGNPPLDLSGPDGQPDCIVNIFDLAVVAAEWMRCNAIPDCDY